MKERNDFLMLPESTTFVFVPVVLPRSDERRGTYSSFQLVYPWIENIIYDGKIQ